MKKYLILLLALSLLFLAFVAWRQNTSSNIEVVQNVSQISPINSETDLTPTPVDISARFEIYTLGTKRIFSDKKYHNLSSDVYITTNDPSLINIKRQGITWQDFFETLPMKLTKDCLITGTGQEFCTNDKNSLKFYINDRVDQNAMEKEIEDGDTLKVLYE